MSSLKEKHLFFSKFQPFFAIFLLLTCWSPAASFWFFSCRHGNGRGDVGDSCSLFCRCRSPNTCEAGVQRCVSPGQLHDSCHMTRPCGKGLSCHPGIQRCYHVPRRLYEPCVAGYDCGNALTCHPGIQVCYHAIRRYNEPCVAGFPCGPGLSCQPGLQRCLHFPRREGERCSLGFECGKGLECTMCGSEPYLTCQMNRVPNMGNEFYSRPYNKVAFLVTHNSFSNSMKYALWVRNQRVSVRRQLHDGVRGFMLDIYPGWGDIEVQLCHGNCFWGGSSSLLDTLIEIRTFMEKNPREVITIIFEDYLRNPTILKRVFDQSQLSRHVLTSNLWGSRYKSWPTLKDMRRLGRLVVFNNIGLDGFPYTPHNMWYRVRENRYGKRGLDTTTCVDRGESAFNARFNTEWSLVLVNWFSTIPNPFDPCLNPLYKLKKKLNSCYKAFGQRANFLAVDYYQNGAKGGAFKALQWLNEQWKGQFKKERRSKTWSLFDAMVTKLFHYNNSMMGIVPNMDQESMTNQSQPHLTDNTVTNHTRLSHNVTHSHMTNETAAMATSLITVQINNLTNIRDYSRNTNNNNILNTSSQMIHRINDTTSRDMTGNTTKYITNDHIINSTNDVKYTGNHVINMTYNANTKDLQTSTSQEMNGDQLSMPNANNSLLNISSHKDMINETGLTKDNIDMYVTRLQATNKSDPSLIDWFTHKTTPLNSSELYFGSNTNSTNKNMTYVNSTNREIAFARVLTNNELNTTSLDQVNKSGHYVRMGEFDLSTPDNGSTRNDLINSKRTDIVNGGNSSWTDGGWQEKSLSSHTDIMDIDSPIDEFNTKNNKTMDGNAVSHVSEDTNFASALPDGHIHNDTNEFTNQTGIIIDNNNKYNNSTVKNDKQHSHYFSFSDNNNIRLNMQSNDNIDFQDRLVQEQQIINNTSTSPITNQTRYEGSAANDTTSFYNGVELRKGLIKIPVSDYQEGAQSLEEYIDLI